MVATKALFIWLIIRLIQLVFSAGIVFFSQKKNQPTVFFSWLIIPAERLLKWQLLQFLPDSSDTKQPTRSIEKHGIAPATVDRKVSGASSMAVEKE
jgi:hypothetical protein